MSQLPRWEPEQAGLSAARLLRARDYARRAGDELGSPGGAAVILRRGAIVGEWYWGQRGLDDPRPFDAHTMVGLASVTKGVTATALALTIQDGLLWLDEPAHRHLPELAEGGRARITVRHLATHSSGLPLGDPAFYNAWESRRPGEEPYAPYVRYALERDLAFAPGTDHTYSDPAVCLLAEIIRRVTGRTVPDLIQERIFSPLGLRRIGWDFPSDLVADVASRHTQEGTLHRGVTAEGRKDGAAWGGMIANAIDLATFGQLLLCDGALFGQRLIAPLAVRMMTTCQMPLPARTRFPHRGLLWWIKAAPDTPELGHLVPDGTYCHGGAAHSVLVVFPALEMVAVMLRNRGGQPPGFIYNRDYPVFMDLVAAAVEDLAAA